MADDITGWIPVPTEDTALHDAFQASAIERFGNPVTMTSDTDRIPRSGNSGHGFRTRRGQSVKVDASLNDKVVIASAFYANDYDVDDAQNQDSAPTFFTEKFVDFLSDYAVDFDTDCIGAAYTPGDEWKSIYAAITSDDSTVGYDFEAPTAAGEYQSANYTRSALADFKDNDGYQTIREASRVLRSSQTIDPGIAGIEAAPFRAWEPANMVAFVHPLLSDYFLGITDDNKRPLLTDVRFQPDQPTNIAGFAAIQTYGAESPTGNPLIVFANRRHVRQSTRRPLEQGFRSSINNPDRVMASTMRVRLRKGFVLAYPQAAAVLELTA